MLVAPSQGDNSYDLYGHPEGSRLRKSRIGAATVRSIDATSDPDGIAGMLPVFPSGKLVVDDGHDASDTRTRNVKIVDWREIAQLLEDRRSAHE